MSKPAITPHCATCSKLTNVYKCEGCEQRFCTQHVTEHHQQLAEQFDAITSHHEQIQRNIAEYTKESSSHPFMKEIDEWEKNSVKKIQEVANNARRQLLSLLRINAASVTAKLESFGKELSGARNNNTFLETELQPWKVKLNKLQDELQEPKTFLVEKDAYSTRFIDPILTVSMSNTSFGHPAGNIDITDHGLVIKQGLLPPTGSARTLGEYSSGCHRFRFKIENLETQPEKKWIFFGIISKMTSVKNQSPTASTVYGWAGRNQVFRNGVEFMGFSEYRSDMAKGDILEILIDCDQKSIRLRNEQAYSQHELEVDVEKCPFPWQPFVSLYYAHDKVRILPS